MLIVALGKEDRKREGGGDMTIREGERDGEEHVGKGRRGRRMRWVIELNTNVIQLPPEGSNTFRLVKLVKQSPPQGGYNIAK